jgi:hypothetical protein
MIKEASTVAEIEALWNCSRYVNIFHATAAVHRLAKIVGVQRHDPPLLPKNSSPDRRWWSGHVEKQRLRAKGGIMCQ